MATSGTSTFNVSAQQLIDISLTDIGANGPAYADPTLRPHALTVLNLLVKSLDTKGIFLWNVPRRVYTMIGGQASYVLQSDTYDIDQPARYTQQGATYGSQVQAMSRDEYMAQPDRTIQGVPYRYFTEKTLDPVSGLQTATVFFFPVPQNSGDTIEFASQTKTQDLTSIAQTIDVNQKWLDAIRWNLTLNLAPAYNAPLDRLQFYRSMASEKLNEALEDDNERGDVQIVPFGGSYSYTYRSNGGRY